MLTIDCKTIVGSLPEGKYAYEYDKYLNFFRTLAYYEEPCLCENVPYCWAPFVWYLGHEVKNTLGYSHLPGWEADKLLWLDLYNGMGDKRRAVEIVSTVRPELVHSLYCIDTEWLCPLRPRSGERGFLVTCNGSFFRDEIKAYRRVLERFTPTRRRAVLVPCAATKPYPAPLHEEVLARLDRSKWHLIIITGVLGMIPEELWDVMPWYDSGMPCFTRCMDTVNWYFTKHAYDGIVSFGDFYDHWIYRGLQGVDVSCEYVLGHSFRDNYQNVTLTEHLWALEAALAKMDRICEGGKP